MLERADEITLQLLFKPIILGLILAIVSALLFSIGGHGSQYKNRLVINLKRSIGFSLPILVLGYVSGYLTGLSRAAAVGNLVPAVLTLVGGLNIYLFRTRPGNTSLTIGYTVFVFAFSILYGIEVGAVDREYNQSDRFGLLADQERRIRNYRSKLDLPTDPPGWITGISKD